MQENKKKITPNESNKQKEIITIGEFIRLKRENKNLSLKQISQKTKISTTKLEFLENDRLDKLPNKAYVKGYIKSYAKILGDNHDEYINNLDETYQILFPQNNAASTAPASNDIDQNINKLIISGVTLTVLCLVVYLL